jgi:predicted amidophosphoribosyltransferase
MGRPAVSGVLGELLGLVAPPACVACGAAMERAVVLVCAPCLRALPWLRGRRCPRCALPRHPARGCPAAGAAFAGAWAPLAYEGSARALVAALKFRGALAVAGLMGAQLAAHLPAALRGPRAPGPGGWGAAGVLAPTLRGPRAPGPEGRGAAGVLAPALVPVPAHPVRRRRRGFDPAAELAAALAARTELPLAPILRRRDRAPRQVGLGRAQRRGAGRLVIEATRAPPPRVLLIDDVHTTGATLDACARALVAAGCGEVVAVTYARAL